MNTKDHTAITAIISQGRQHYITDRHLNTQEIVEALADYMATDDAAYRLSLTCNELRELQADKVHEFDREAFVAACYGSAPC